MYFSTVAKGSEIITKIDGECNIQIDLKFSRKQCIASPIILNLSWDGRKWECVRRFPSSSKEEGRIKRNRRKHQFSLERRRRISPPTPTGTAADCKTLYNVTRARSLRMCVHKVRAQRVSLHAPDTFILIAKLQCIWY